MMPALMAGDPTRDVPVPIASHRCGEHAARQHTILVVDDDDANLKIARFVLEADGYNVVEAIDAISTFEVLKTCVPSVIVMDVQLPGMDGWELTRRLKSNAA